MLNKKLLIIGPKFFGYTERIYQNLKKDFLFVEMYYDLYNISFKDRIFRKILKKYEINRINKYYDDILKQIAQKKYDVLLVIKGEYIPENFFLELKKINKNMIMINYQWDDIINCKKVINNFKYYNDIFTYSISDSNAYNIKFRPFFYEDNLININDIKNKREYDYLFIGSYHGNRLLILEKILKKLKTNKQKIYIYINPITFIKNIFKIKFKMFKYLRFKQLSYNNYIKLLANSKVIIDIQHLNQKGLTTRFFETLLTRTKILTINEECKKYSLYNKNNIFIINMENYDFDNSFIKKNYQDLNINLKLEYSFTTWKNEIFKGILKNE